MGKKRGFKSHASFGHCQIVLVSDVTEKISASAHNGFWITLQPSLKVSITRVSPHDRCSMFHTLWGQLMRNQNVFWRKKYIRISRLSQKWDKNSEKKTHSYRLWHLFSSKVRIETIFRFVPNVAQNYSSKTHFLKAESTSTKICHTWCYIFFK